MIRIPLILLWLFVFTLGRQVSASALDQESPFYWLLFMLTSTATNVGVLCVISSYAAAPGISSTPLLRGFIIYLCLLAGTIAVFTESITAPSPDQFIKLAANMSLLCVLANVPPEVYTDIKKLFRKETP